MDGFYVKPALLANGWTGVPIETVLGITVGNTLEALTGAYLLRRVARFRTSAGVERLQYRWLAWALALAGVGTVTWALLVIVLKIDLLLLANGVVLLTYPAVPIAIVIAVLVKIKWLRKARAYIVEKRKAICGFLKVAVPGVEEQLVHEYR